MGAFLLLSAGTAAAQTCLTGPDMDPATRSSLENSATRFFQYASAGDYAGLRQNASPAVASSFNSIVGAIGDNKSNLQAAQASVRASYLLDATSGSSQGGVTRFFCGIVNSPDSVAFGINNLPAGRYGIAILDVRGGKSPLMFTEILQQGGAAWQLAGLYIRPTQIAGHDGNWYLTQARAYKAKGQTHNAWFYYLTAWDLMAPVNFMSTAQLEKIGEEMQSSRPADLPTPQATQDLLAGGKTYRLTQMFATPVGDNLDVVVKYQTPSVADSSQSFQDNTAVIKALLAKYPELREAFGAVVARAVQPDGQDYGTVLAMKDVK